MKTLQKIFEKEIQNILTFPAVGAKLIKRQFGKKGITLTDKQVAELEKKLQDISDDLIDFDFDLNNEQKKVLGISNGEKIVIDIGGEKELDEFFDEFSQKIQTAFPEILEELTILFLTKLKKQIPFMLKAQRKDMNGFVKRLNADWKKPFDLFETLIFLAFEAGNEFNKEFRNDKSESENFVLEVLTRLHARACQIASEVLALLKSGFADGAHARWRSLHEIAVVSSFIKMHGNEIAERYLLHNNIESYKAAVLYQKYYQKLGAEPLSQDEFDAIKAVRDNLIERYGNSYKNDYGWASSVLNKDAPSFSDIETCTGLDHLHPHYKLASHNVHANPKGVLFKLGLLENTSNILLAGPSNIGFTDPAQETANSLGLITVTLLTLKPTVDNLVLCKILLKLESQIGKEFFQVQKVIERKNYNL